MSYLWALFYFAPICRSRSPRSYVALFSGAPLLARITVAATALVAAMENQTLQQNFGVSCKYAESPFTPLL